MSRMSRAGAVVHLDHVHFSRGFVEELLTDNLALQVELVHCKLNLSTGSRVSLISRSLSLAPSAWRSRVSAREISFIVQSAFVDLDGDQAVSLHSRRSCRSNTRL